MVRLLLTAIIITLTCNAYSQKKKVIYDKETGSIEVNGEPYAQLEKENAPGQLGINKNFTVLNLEGKELIYMAFKQRVVIINGKKETRSYYLITFLGSNRSSIKKGTMTANGTAKLIVKNNLIVENEIDPTAEKKFHLKY